MNFSTIVYYITIVTANFFNVCHQTYIMITSNYILLIFVLVFALFVGLALLKRLIHIN